MTDEGLSLPSPFTGSYQCLNYRACTSPGRGHEKRVWGWNLKSTISVINQHRPGLWVRTDGAKPLVPPGRAYVRSCGTGSQAWRNQALSHVNRGEVTVYQGHLLSKAEPETAGGGVW